MPHGQRPPGFVKSFMDVVRRTVQQGDSPIGRFAGEVAQAVAPHCRICNDLVLTPIPCMLCGRYHCEEHAFFHIRPASLCTECLGEAFELDLDGVGYAEGTQGAGESGYGWPWEDLGIGPTDDVIAIRAAFRKIATETHPDRFSDPEEVKEAQKRFQRAKNAYDEALQIAQERRR